jgi:hypothetical protein
MLGVHAEHAEPEGDCPADSGCGQREMFPTHTRSLDHPAGVVMISYLLVFSRPGPEAALAALEALQ